MAEAGVYQSDLIPQRGMWESLPFSAQDCADAIGRARQAIDSPAAVADINRRLGIRVDEIPAVVVMVGRVDANGNEPGRPNYPAFAIDSSVCEYLRLDPNNSQVEFRWTLGVFSDPVMGPIPVLFLVSRVGSDTRCVALVWSLAKERDRDHFGYLLQSRMLADTTERGMEGGLAMIYQTGFIVDGATGGLDILAGGYIIPWKIWNTLSMSVYSNAVATAFTKTAMAWPYPIDMSDEGIFRSLSGSSAPSWY